MRMPDRDGHIVFVRYDNPTSSTRDKGIRLKNTTNAMVGITVTAMVATGVLAVFTNWKSFKKLFKKKEKAKAFRIVPAVGPRGGGLFVTSDF